MNGGIKENIKMNRFKWKNVRAVVFDVTFWC